MRSDHGVPSLPSDRTPPAPRLPTRAGPDGHAKAGRVGSPPPSPPLPPPARPSPLPAARMPSARHRKGPESPPPTAVGLTHVLRFACPTDLRHFREGGRSDTSRKAVSGFAARHSGSVQRITIASASGVTTPPQFGGTPSEPPAFLGPGRAVCCGLARVSDQISAFRPFTAPLYPFFPLPRGSPRSPLNPP